MVAINAYTWHEWATGTTTETLYGAHLNAMGDYVSALINKGITGANIATGGVDAGALIAVDIIGEAHIDHSKASGARLLQIGKNTAVTGQMIVKGTTLITAAATTNTDVTVYFTGGDCCTAGDPAFAAVPMVWAEVYTTQKPTITVKACATDSCLVNVDCYDTETFANDWTLRWCAIGNK
jgi:hypothetical protein